MADLTSVMAALGSNGEYLPPMPAIPAGHSPTDPKKLLASDRHEVTARQAVENDIVADIIGKTFWLIYEDVEGEASERRITLRSITSRNRTYYLMAYCHERRAARQFRADRVIEIHDLTTGEIIEDVEVWCSAFAKSDPTGDLIRKMRAELGLLTFLAKCDGLVTHDEIELIVDYMLDCDDRSNYDEERVRAEVKSMHPDTDTLLNSMTQIARMGRQRVERLDRVIRRIVDSDDLLHDKEFNLLTAFGDAIQSKRDHWQQMELERDYEYYMMGLSDGVPLEDLLADMPPECHEEFRRVAAGWHRRQKQTSET